MVHRITFYRGNISSLSATCTYSFRASSIFRRGEERHEVANVYRPTPCVKGRVKGREEKRGREWALIGSE